ncbi:hypothetical protein AMJ87_13710 [candidate division WOR_3 bacterium SM23_60]|uniref:Uncharacterized protein n=1 Tax=candidate division WOR_3 bacterium SM23_60 TaxID=1703780 RepID=A0A0S8G2J3_UNCW3|nr:MAG: hypothetical protein AMJ87_13710 [candidate division WOR_3 bacterium SM23_60]
MKRVLFFLVVLCVFYCGAPGVEHIITQKGGVFEFDGMRLEFPEMSVVESTAIEIEIKSTNKKTYEHGFRRLGTAFTVLPHNVSFDEPGLFSMPVENANTVLAAQIGNGFVPLASAVVDQGVLTARIWHGGTYELIETPQHYGIIGHTDGERALLVVTDVYVSDHVKNLTQTLKSGGYPYPVWTFVYPGARSIRDNAQFLAHELNKLHEQYGDFLLDIVSFGIGGLITHCYVSDTALYQRDFSSAIITAGTPFFGSAFADIENATKASNPYRFFYIDGLGAHVDDILPESEFIAWVSTQKGIIRGHYYDNIEENKNFASLSGRYRFDGEFAEESNGDGLVSVPATMLTPIEPVPFHVDHIALFEKPQIHAAIREFVQLYRSFTWPVLFSKVWNGQETLSKIPEAWEKEARLIYHKPADFDALVEFNRNMLNSAPENAILMTNGDNDTYPAWFLQNKGVRTDVIIVNRSLLNLPDYALFLQEHGLPLSVTRTELETMEHDYNKETSEFVSKSDKLIKRLLKQKVRPVVFATTVYEPQKFGYPLKLSGMVYEIGEGEIDIEKTKEFLYTSLVDDVVSSVIIDSLTEHIQNIVANYAASSFKLAEALEKQEKFADALKAMKFARRFGDTPLFYLREAEMYTQMKRFDLADSTLEALLKMQNADVQLKREIALMYHNMDMNDKAIKLLAECLQGDPNDRESLELIKEYQEE